MGGEGAAFCAALSPIGMHFGGSHPISTRCVPALPWDGAGLCSSQASHINPVSIPYQSRIKSTSIPDQSCINPISIPKQSRIDPVSTPYQSCINLISSPYQSHIDHVSIPYQPPIHSISILYQSCISLISIPYQSHFNTYQSRINPISIPYQCIPSPADPLSPGGPILGTRGVGLSLPLFIIPGGQ